ncbi:MAG TPA: NUDIX hydrolase [Opitutaceae bacterium]|nr:NUDIX hydrolase [Opitutaceae bacterium]
MDTPKLLHANRWISLYERAGWVYATRRAPDAPRKLDAATIIALHGDAADAGAPRRLVVIEEFRVPIDGWEFGLPAGLLDGDESIAECARRELREETGLELERVIETSGLTYSSPGLTDESQAFAVVTCSGTPSLKPGIEGEQIKVHLLGQSGCRDLLARNREGTAAISSRVWPLIMAVAHAGSFAGVKVAD